MDGINLTILGRRVETLIARFEIVGQDVATLRQRVEEVKAHSDIEMESLRLHIDAEFKRILDGQADMTAMLRQLLEPKP